MIPKHSGNIYIYSKKRACIGEVLEVKHIDETRIHLDILLEEKFKSYRKPHPVFLGLDGDLNYYECQSESIDRFKDKELHKKFPGMFYYDVRLKINSVSPQVSPRTNETKIND